MLLQVYAILSVCSASIIIQDPSDYMDLAADASDNSIKAIYNIKPSFTQLKDVTGPYVFSGESHSIDHASLSVNANDTSVVVMTNGSNISLSHLSILKQGYASNLYQSSFYGINAAINVANHSHLSLSHCNISTHNGAANIYAYGTNTTVNVTSCSLYSSGPVAHGLYASGNATIYAKDIRHYSGGNRCSSFSGDNPAGYIYVENSVAHTNGIGSAIFYALGEIHATNVFGWAEKAPVLFSDGAQKSILRNVDLRSDFLAGTVLFSSMRKLSGAFLRFEGSRLRVTGRTQPAMWFGNIGARVEIVDTEILTKSGVLVVANRSQVTQEFSFFAGSEENPGIASADVDISIAESSLKGDIVAMNGSTISWSLLNYSSWVGAAVLGPGGGEVGVSLDKTSMWTLTSDVMLANFTNQDLTCSNVNSNGFSISYAGSTSANAWLGNVAKKLKGGGLLKPY